MRVSLCLYIGVRVRGRARGMCGAGAERLEPSPEHTNRIMLSSTLKRRPPRRCFLPLRFECSETHAGSSMPAVDHSVPPNTYQKRASDLPASQPWNQMGKGHNAKGATGKKKKPVGSKSKADQPRSIEKRKHARGDSDGKRKLVQKLQADAPPRKAVQKQKQKRAANAGVLGAVAGLRGSLDDLIHASEERVRERAAAAEGVEKASKKSMSSKRRQQLVVDETQHMQEVLSHPAFIANPFAALQEHLSNTVTAPASKEKLKERGSKSDRRYMQDE